MGLDNINDRQVEPNPLADREVSPGAVDIAESQVEISFETARSNMEEMLTMNYGVIQELLGQIVVINPFRPDMSQSKQPDIATIDAVNEVKSTPIAPTGKSSSSAYISGLQHINDVLSNHDMQLQQVFDRMELSRSGRKPVLHDQGIEYERLMTFINQAETRLYMLGNLFPETLPDNLLAQNGITLQALMPEFSDSLKQYDASLQQILAAIQYDIQQAEIGQ